MARTNEELKALATAVHTAVAALNAASEAAHSAGLEVRVFQTELTRVVDMPLRHYRHDAVVTISLPGGVE